MQTKVKIVAIAKDESAYLSEWVHHHLYLGFDAIEIYLNRTSDNSAAVLKNINNQYPNVTWDYADWVDTCPGEASKHIQFITYARALHELKKSNEFTHVLFLDIDEFLILDGLTTSVSDFIGRYPKNSAISLEWLNDCQQATDAFSPVSKTVVGNLSPLVKTILPVNVEVAEFRHHVPAFAGKIKHVLVDGKGFKPRSESIQAVHPSRNSLKSSFILHRANRSENEYISLLYRGRPGDEFAYKSNRRGFPVKNKKTLEIGLDAVQYDKYRDSFTSFKLETSYDSHIKQAKQFVTTRYELSINNLAKHLNLDYPLMMRLFLGVKDPKVLTAFRHHRKMRINSNSQNVEMIRDFAIDAQKQDIDEAIQLMNIAIKLRPNGPQIISKLAEFRELKNQG
ncbi:glycosyltransferase family 2 protein [Shewanella benthica]|uniref:glycosyltransferase family 2 protein n=1 Tax=Shewanella benthica TaxID=43661 RepID=UPI001879F9A3|nr:glycosyltransferase family 2 protein [Shewanella benthica]MBE7213948.1 glycosyltransferase family 2 protein [Shewanella benthica]MCL1063837.1 glycosyltransferase family 2 protein [Shewanella benthica]